MASGTRYRYKGHFISASKAARLHNLKHAKKYLSTEYTFKGKADSIRKGYLLPIETRVARAIKHDFPTPIVKLTKKQQSKLEQKRFETIRLQRDAKRIVQKADFENTSLEDAADSEFDPDSYSFYDFNDVMDLASGFESDIEALDFTMSNLEQDERIS